MLCYLCRMLETLLILAAAAVFFVIGKIRSDVVALCALILLMLLGILTPAEALSGFSNSVVVMMVGLFVVGGAIFRTGLAKMISGRILKLAGKNETRLFLLVVVTTAFIGGFVSNTGTVALMLPIVVSLAAAAGLKASRLLMPLAFASSMGGMLTLIGTPPNLVISETLEAAGYEPLAFFDFLPVGILCIVIGIVLMFPLTRRLLKDRSESDEGKAARGKSLRQLVSEYHLTDNLSVFKVRPTSLINGKTVAEVGFHSHYGLVVLEVRRDSTQKSGLLKSVVQKLAGPDTILQSDDIIYINGDRQQAQRLADDYGLIRYEGSDGHATGRLDFYDIGMAEIVLLPSSRLVRRLIREANFRSKYNINIVAIRRSGEYIMDNLADHRLRANDVLLIQGTWKDIQRMTGDEEHWVVLGQPVEEAARVTLDYKAPLAAFIMVLMVAMMVFDFIPVAGVTAVMIAAVLMVLCGCFRNVGDAYKSINWESIVLIAAMMPMSVAMQKTGASAMISHALVDALGSVSPIALIAGIYFTTSLLSLFISNTATAVLMAPIAMTSAVEMGVSPYPLLFAVTLGASLTFATPFCTPPNALVMQAGHYRFVDYVKVGLPLQIVMGVIMIALLPLLFPL